MARIHSAFRLPHLPNRNAVGQTAGTGWIDDLRGALRLGVDATLGVTDVVEHLHQSIRSVRAPISTTGKTKTDGITGLVYRSVRSVMHGVGFGIDGVLQPLNGWLPRTTDHDARNLVVAIINGIHGDHLEATGNPLAIPMTLRVDGQQVDVRSPVASLTQCLGRAPRSKLIVLIHGLCMNDGQWRRNGYSHADRFRTEVAADVLHLHYNSGRQIHDNGASLAGLLESLVSNWNDAPPDLVLIGHSMGGLVARSACAQAAGSRWLQQVKQIIVLGSPHHGAPLERGGFHLDQILGLSPYLSPFAKIGKTRSAGIQDLRHGRILPGDPRPVPLPSRIPCFAMAARLDPVDHERANQFIGDGLVPLASALGDHPDPAWQLGIPAARRQIMRDRGHLELLWDEQVGATLVRWLVREE